VLFEKDYNPQNTNRKGNVFFKTSKKN